MGVNCQIGDLCQVILWMGKCLVIFRAISSSLPHLLQGLSLRGHLLDKTGLGSAEDHFGGSCPTLVKKNPARLLEHFS